MPYALVELTDARGCKELVPVPETWIEQRDRAVSYLCWPNTKNINILNMLVADEQSKPSPIWETHKCEVKRTSIPSFLLAGKMANIRQKLFKPKSTTQSQQDESTFSIWTGCSRQKEVKKYAMRSYKNILQFFAHAGSTSTFRVGPKFLAMFFMNRLNLKFIDG
ncbi:uncharacterized protein LOC128727209 [Anopheles nili]|uniref:uncharacterized protein LOC128727209 n=1 Tax=Anopheles nili TaxID=185578 RepID=UPI00237A625C|nr:uncharacterized protein LOC128727209 [Anopheles nili]